ncbi:MAG: hypothetical protein KBF71_03865 [Alphaproteobacteria bacterium]|jgi:hypothetical protein|nr:hypothetical protein [Alphaproteobacteria bacterium]
MSDIKLQNLLRTIFNEDSSEEASSNSPPSFKAQSSSDSSSSSVSSSENHKQRPPIRKAPAQDFSLDIKEKSVMTRSQSKSEDSSDQSPKIARSFQYRTKTKPSEVLIFSTDQEIVTHIQTSRSNIQTSPSQKKAKPSAPPVLSEPRVLKVNQSKLSASTVWDLLNALHLKRCRSVSFTRCKNLSAATFNILSVKIKKLRHLELADVKLETIASQEALASLILKNKDFLKNINLSNTNLNHKILEALLQCPNLKSLDLSGCYFSIEDSEDFPQETEAEFAALCSAFQLKLFRSCLKLEHLNLSNFPAPFDHMILIDILAALKEAEFIPPLKSFVYDHVNGIDAAVFQNVLEYFPHLEMLSLNGTGNLTDLPYMPKNLPHLKHLGLSGHGNIPFNILESDSKHISKLESLDLSSFENYVSLRLSSFLLKKGHNLKNLNLDIKTFLYAHLIRMLKGIGPSQKEKQQYERLETVRKLLAIVLNGKITSDTHISHISLYDLLLEIKSELPANTKDSSKIEVAEKLWGVRLKLDALAKEKSFSKHNLLHLLKEIQKIIKDDALAPLNLQEHLTKIFNLEKSAHDILSKHLKSMTPVQLAPASTGLGGQLKSLIIPAKFMTPGRIKEILSHCPQLETLNGLPVNSSSQNV